jgi:hypothetical protein
MRDDKEGTNHIGEITMSLKTRLILAAYYIIFIVLFSATLIVAAIALTNP